MTAAIAKPTLIDPSADEFVGAWQNPPVVFLATWRADDAQGFVEAVSDLVFELQLEEAVEDVVSAFSLLDPATGTNPLEAADLSGQPDKEALAELRSMLFGDQFVGPDLRSTVVMASGDTAELGGLGARFARCSAGQPMCIQEIGSAAIERSIEAQLRFDNMYLPVLSGLISTAIVAFWYGHLGTAIALMIPPSFGLLWYIASMALAGVPLDVFNSLIPPVLLTLGLADMLHLKRGADELDQSAGAAELLKRVLPPITLTTLTTGLAFAAMAFEDSVALQRLAFCGATGVAILWLSIVLLGPWAAMRHRAQPGARSPGKGFSAWLFRGARGALARPRGILAGAFAALALGLASVLSTGANFEFEENLPRGTVAQAVNEAVEAGLAMAPIFAILSDASEADETAAIEALYGEALSSADQIEQMGQMRTEQGGLALPIPVATGTNARDIKALEARLQGDLPTGVTAQIVGYPLTVADTILAAIERLQIVLVMCFLILAALLAALMRSLRVGIITLLPNALPLLAIHAVMALEPGWITVSATVAMIIASGIVVDDTSHLLWASRTQDGLDVTNGLRQTLEPITLTTLCLMAAFAVVGLSGLPGLQLLGLLMVLALFVAWIADIFVLPALVGASREASRT